MEEFHFDGFRFDGVGSMMYFHHGNEPMDSREKYFGQGVEYDAITYLQLANKFIDKPISKLLLIHKVNIDRHDRFGRF